mgnify:CR=1 FL=1
MGQSWIGSPALVAGDVSAVVVLAELATDGPEFVNRDLLRVDPGEGDAGLDEALADPRFSALVRREAPLRDDVEEVHAWAIVGMNVFLGLRYGVMGEDRDANEVAQIVADFLTHGLKR